jgi:pimeloyl-ACP methyl ester carboxylesterase
MEIVAVEHDRLVAYERWGDLDGQPMFSLHGTPGGGPHALACAAELGHRVLACAAVASAAPLLPGEVEDLIGVNRKAPSVLAEYRRPGMVDSLGSLRDQFLADPVGALRVQLADAPAVDIHWNQREDVQTVRREAILEALRPGVQGWADDSVSIFGEDWNVDLGRVTCPVRSLHLLPLTRRLVRPRVKTVHARNEELQARCLHRQLALLDSAGVDGAFVFTITAPLWPHDDDPKHDLDTDSFSLVKSCPGRRRGTPYPEMAWEPKQAFHAIAKCYASD